MITVSIIIILMFPGTDLSAQNSSQNRAETYRNLLLGDSASIVKSNRFYKALLNRYSKSKLSGLILRSILSNNNRYNDDINESRLSRDIDYFSNYHGKKIHNIYIFRANIFNNTDTTNTLQKRVENFHRLTRESVIRKNLFFKTGEVVDAPTLVRNEQFLRTFDYLSDAYIVVQDFDAGQVDIYVYTRDNLSFSPAFEAQGTRKYYISLQESNLAGSGNLLEAGTFLSGESPVYKGYKAQFKIRNLLGRFFDFRFTVYQDYSNSLHGGALNKKFILPKDYAGGVSYEIKRYNVFQRVSDTTVRTGENTFDVWLGKSFVWRPNFPEFYLTGRFTDIHFPIRYDVNQAYNSLFYNRKQTLLNAGFFRENFYRGHLIYGFGRSEDIPFGYRWDFTAGKTWEEYSHRYYIGTKLQFASITPHGFISTKGELGSYYNAVSRRYEQSVFSAESFYFSRLIKAGRWGIRNFASARYMRGYNRLVGEGEKLFFQNGLSPRVIEENTLSGYNRLLTSVETVGFSPINIHNFRFALYSFVDCAWLGYDKNIFRNDCLSSVGVGVRIKNERLFFQTIQIRLGLSLSKNSTSSVNWIDLSEESRMKSERLMPDAPGVAGYK